MADADQINSDTSTNCTRCKNPARTGIRCVRCGKVSHKSCLKIIKNVKFLDDDTVICCATEVLENQTDFQDKVTLSRENNVNSNTLLENVKEMKISHLKEIICLKDLIINNQAIAIKALTDQVASLKHSLSFFSGFDLPSTNSSQDSNKPGNIISVDKASSSVALSAGPVISQKAVASAIHNAKAQSVCKEIINLEMDSTKQQEVKPSTKTKARKILVGKQDNMLNCPFKAAAARPTRRLYEYHVTNLDPDTDVAALSDYLKGLAPNVTVDKLNSKNPQKYSSFKVSIPEDESVCILDSSIWPNNVVVNRFFRSKGSRGASNNPASN